MRKIKFRAWHRKKKLMRNVTSLVDIYHCSARAEIDKHTLEEWDFDDIELMQYIGLKDKNGKEIYEGDIFGAKERWFKPKVKYSSNKGGFIIGNLAPEILLHDYLKDNPEFEIIGNIYENPEYLEERNGKKKSQ